jgi:dienelactone hydrolase
VAAVRLTESQRLKPRPQRQHRDLQAVRVRALSVAGVDHDVKEYPAAEHGSSTIMNHDRADVPTLFVVMGKISGAKYHEPSAQDARRRIVSFFNTHLKS